MRSLLLRRVAQALVSVEPSSWCTCTCDSPSPARAPAPPPHPAQHPWSAGAAPWLTANVLGITPLEPGFASVAVAPHITEAMAAAGGLRGSAPTPRGAVAVEVATGSAAGTFVVVSAPAGVDVLLRLSEPLLARLGWVTEGAGGLESVRVSVDGAAPVKLKAALGLAGPRFEGELASRGAGRSAVAVVELRGGGAFKVTLGAAAATSESKAVGVKLGAVRDGESITAGGSKSAAASTAPAPFPPPSWPARVVAIDSWTQGRGFLRSESAFSLDSSACTRACTLHACTRLHAASLHAPAHAELTALLASVRDPQSGLGASARRATRSPPSRTRATRAPTSSSCRPGSRASSSTAAPTRGSRRRPTATRARCRTRRRAAAPSAAGTRRARTSSTFGWTPRPRRAACGGSWP